jgi:hypothetical protein
MAGARPRIEALVDPDSFDEFGSLARHRSTAFGMDRRRPVGDGVVTGYARIDGPPVGLFAQDSSVLGGSLGEMHANKIVHKSRLRRADPGTGDRAARLGRCPDPGRCRRAGRARRDLPKTSGSPVGSADQRCARSVRRRLSILPGTH